MTDNSAETARELLHAYSDWAWNKEGQPLGSMSKAIATQAAFMAGAAHARTAATVSRDREAIARIIDPTFFSDFEEHIECKGAEAEREDRLARWLKGGRWTEALAKADAILSLPPVGPDETCSHPWAAPDDNGQPYCQGCGIPWRDAQREIDAREECARRGIDPDELCADGGVEAWMVVDKELFERTHPPKPPADAGAEAMREAFDRLDEFAREAGAYGYKRDNEAVRLFLQKARSALAALPVPARQTKQTS